MPRGTVEFLRRGGMNMDFARVYDQIRGDLSDLVDEGGEGDTGTNVGEICTSSGTSAPKTPKPSLVVENFLCDD